MVDGVLSTIALRGGTIYHPEGSGRFEEPPGSLSDGCADYVRCLSE